jgi:hypothetical protein
VKETKAEVLSASEEELAHKKARFDGARFALAAALQRSHTARRCAYAEAVAAAAGAHAAFFRAGDDACAALDGRAAGLRAAAATERVEAARAQATLAAQAAALQAPPGATGGAGGRAGSGGGGGVSTFALPSASASASAFTLTRSASSGSIVTAGVLTFAEGASEDEESPREGGTLGGPGGSGALACAPFSPELSPHGTVFSSDRSRSVGAAMAAAAASGAVVPLKQGYLLKQSHSLYADWKRRYFVLDSRGDLRYFRDDDIGLLDRLGGRTPRNTAAPGRENSGIGGGRAAAATVSLLTSTIKRDGGDGAAGLRFCFRVVSPAKEYTLQAENAAEQADWMEAIAGAIAELLCGSAAHAAPPGAPGTLQPGGGSGALAAQLPPLPSRARGLARNDSGGSTDGSVHAAAGEGGAEPLARGALLRSPRSPQPERRSRADGAAFFDLESFDASAPSPAAGGASPAPGTLGHRRSRSLGSSNEVFSPAAVRAGGSRVCALRAHAFMPA